MGHGGDGFTPASGRQVGEDCRHNLPGDIRKSVAVEEKKRGAAVALTKELYRLAEGEDLLLPGLPFCRCRLLSLSIKAVLRASSCARSAVEADDKLPTPVFEKSGSGL